MNFSWIAEAAESNFFLRVANYNVWDLKVNKLCCIFTREASEEYFEFEAESINECKTSSEPLTLFSESVSHDFG